MQIFSRANRPPAGVPNRVILELDPPELLGQPTLEIDNGILWLPVGLGLTANGAIFANQQGSGNYAGVGKVSYFQDVLYVDAGGAQSNGPGCGIVFRTSAAGTPILANRFYVNDSFCQAATPVFNVLTLNATQNANVFGTLKATGAVMTGYTPRNAVIDGGFEVWDGNRNANYTGVSGYTGLTMWSMIATGAGSNVNMSRQPGLTPQSRFCCRMQRVAGNADVNNIYLLYDVDTPLSIAYAGKTICISYTARAGANFSAAGGTLNCFVFYGTGTDQNLRTGYTTQTLIGASQPSLTTTSTQYFCTAAVPAGASQIGVYFFWAPVGAAGAADYYEIDDVQIEIGTVPSQFEVVPFDIVYARTRRYYRKSFNYDTAPAQAAGYAGVTTYLPGLGGIAFQQHTVQLDPPMRVAPQGTFYNPATATTNWRNATRAADSGPCTFAGIGQNGEANVTLENLQIAADGAGHFMCVHYQFDARL